MKLLQKSFVAILLMFILYFAGYDQTSAKLFWNFGQQKNQQDQKCNLGSFDILDSMINENTSAIFPMKILTDNPTVNVTYKNQLCSLTINNLPVYMEFTQTTRTTIVLLPRGQEIFDLEINESATPSGYINIEHYIGTRKKDNTKFTQHHITTVHVVAQNKGSLQRFLKKEIVGNMLATAYINYYIPNLVYEDFQSPTISKDDANILTDGLALLVLPQETINNLSEEIHVFRQLTSVNSLIYKQPLSNLLQKQYFQQDIIYLAKHGHLTQRNFSEQYIETYCPECVTNQLQTENNIDVQDIVKKRRKNNKIKKLQSKSFFHSHKYLSFFNKNQYSAHKFFWHLNKRTSSQKQSFPRPVLRFAFQKHTSLF